MGDEHWVESSVGFWCARACIASMGDGVEAATLCATLPGSTPNGGDGVRSPAEIRRRGDIKFRQLRAIYI